MKTVRMLTMVFAAMALITAFVACNDDEETPAVLASFTYQVDATNFKMVTFTNTSQNYASVSWNFGDNSALSFEVNPVHTYAELGDYTVTLTANASDGSKDVYTTTITIADPNAELTKLVGETSKTWKLIRVTDSGRYPIEVGPEDHSMIWWAMGLNNDELANRPCMLNDEWTFNRDLTMVFDAKGDYWAEGGIFDPENICNTTDQMVGNEGEDLSAWGGGTFNFDMTTGTGPTITVNGLGAFIGFFKLGNGTEVDVPQETVTYDIVKLTDDEVDTLIVEGIYRWDPNASGGYWRFTLVHYDDPSQEPPIPAPAPIASFTTTISGLTISCNNTTQYGQTYNWDFGDGTTSTEQNPVHTYPGDGIYLCKLTATNPNGNSSAELFQMVSASTLTDEVLQGTWKIRPEAFSIFVGPGMGSHTWWSVPVEFFTSGTGGDDWSCIVDDEFTFVPGGVYTYDGNGSVRNDGYFGAPNGCWDESALTGNGLYFASGNHTYAFTPASGSSRATILLTNGPDRAAFLGFYKGYYGGENTEGTIAPNGGNPTNKYEVMGYCALGGKEYLFVTIDIRATLIGEASWSVILER